MKRIIMIAVGLIGSVLHAIPEEVANLGYQTIVLIRETKPSEDLVRALIYVWGRDFNSYEEYDKKKAEFVAAIKGISDADLAVLKQKYEERKKERAERQKRYAGMPEPQKNVKNQKINFVTGKAGDTRDFLQSMSDRFNRNQYQAQRYVDEAKQKRAEVVINKFVETWSDAAVKNALKDVVHAFVVAWKPSLNAQQRTELQSTLEIGIKNMSSGERSKLSEQEDRRLRSVAAVYGKAIENVTQNNDVMKRLFALLLDAAQEVRDQFKQK